MLSRIKDKRGELFATLAIRAKRTMSYTSDDRTPLSLKVKPCRNCSCAVYTSMLRFVSPRLRVLCDLQVYRSSKSFRSRPHVPKRQKCHRTAKRLCISPCAAFDIQLALAISLTHHQQFRWVEFGRSSLVLARLR